ncbi:MAG: 2-C-methyl-D-erythritol 2,4-cyclodiphosphate synthase, partial [Planctomycetota bacterium]
MTNPPSQGPQLSPGPSPSPTSPSPSPSSGPNLRIGHGYDLHRLAPLAEDGPSTPVRPLIIGGTRFEHTHGVIAHSDGDALFHAVTDAILGALALPDIGQLFPNPDPRHDAEDSSVFLIEAARRARDAGWEVINLDTTVILERPKLGPHKPAIMRSLAQHLGIPTARVNVKGKTHEGVDAVGEGRA